MECHQNVSCDTLEYFLHAITVFTAFSRLDQYARIWKIWSRVFSDLQYCLCHTKNILDLSLERYHFERICFTLYQNLPIVESHHTGYMFGANIVQLPRCPGWSLKDPRNAILQTGFFGLQDRWPTDSTNLNCVERIERLSISFPVLSLLMTLSPKDY